MKNEIIKILILEDVESDILILEHYLKKAEFKYITKSAKTKQDYQSLLKSFQPDIILSDYNIPGFSGLQALEEKLKVLPEIPFILVTGFLDGETAVKIIKKGAWNYILKDNFTRLIPAVESALRLKREKELVIKTGKKLMQSENRFEIIFNKSAEPIIIVDAEQNRIPVIKDVNEAVKKIIKKEIIGIPVSVLIPHISEKELIRVMDRVKGGETIKDFVTFKKNNLTTLYFNVTASLILFNNEKNILITASNITEKHIVELKLKKQNKTFRKLYKEYIKQNEKLQNIIIQLKKIQKELTKKIDIINRSPAVVFLWENKPGWPVKMVSKNVEYLANYSVEEFTNKGILYEQIIHPEDLLRVKNELNIFIENPAQNKTKHKPYRIITKDGKIKWVSDNTRILRKNTEAIFFEGIIYDITDQIIAQQKLQNSEKRYRSVLEHNPDSVLIVSKDKKIKYFNSKAKRIFKNVEENAICHQVLFGLNEPCSWCAQKYIDNYETYQNEIVIPQKNNTYLYSSSKINDNNGQSDYVSVYSDITEYKKLLQEKHYFIDALEKELNEIYFIKTDDFRIIYTNAEAEKKIAYEKEQILNKKIYQFQTKLTKKKYQKYFYRLSVKKEKTIYFETSHIRSDGSSYPVSVTLKLNNYNDQTIILAVVKDISERKERDNTIRLLSAAVHQTPVSVVITNEKGDIEYINPWFSKVTGYSFKEVLGQNPRILKSGFQPDSFYNELWDTISSGKIWRGEFYNKKKNGHFFWEKAVINPVTDSTGKITHYIAVKEDISKQKKIREQLKKSEEHFRLLFENSLIGMYLIDSEGRIENANKAFLNILGYESLEEIYLKKLDKLKEATINRADFNKLMNQNNFITGFESLWYGKNKKMIYVRENTRKYVDEEGSVFFEGTIEDITKEKTAQRKLKEMHDFNETLIKEGKLGYALYQNDGKCIRANKEFAIIVGAEVRDIENENFYKNKKWQDFNLIETAEKCLEEGIHKKQIIVDSSSYGKEIFAEISFNRIFFGAKPILLVILKDVSGYIKAKRRQMQTKSEYINLIESINIPVFGIDIEGRIKIWNKKISEITGYERSEVKGKTIKDFILDSKNTFFLTLIKNEFSDHSLSDNEINFKTKNGDIIRLLISSTMQLDNKDKLMGITCIAYDITEKEKQKADLEKQIQERTRDLIVTLKKEKELGDLKSQFVSMTSHEFRTPLSAIKLAAGFIRKYYDKAEKEKILQKTEKIESQIVHMTNLLEDVLTIGKIESGKIKFNPEILNLTEFLYNIIEDVKNVTRNTHKINFTYNDSKCLLKSDEKILRNIFINLLRNAIKFSPDANEIFFNLESNDNTVKLQVKDLGIGIKPKELEKIFIPFRRGQNVETIQGTGLGLAIVKESIELLKGTITVKSKLGKGTEFTVILPKKLNNYDNYA